MNNELSYWLALALTPTIKTKKKNDILVRLHKQEKTLADFFQASETQWKEQFDITDKEKEHFRQSVTSLPNYAFLAEELLNQGYNIVPITSKDYSPILKKKPRKDVCTTGSVYKRKPANDEGGCNRNCRFTKCYFEIT